MMRALNDRQATIGRLGSALWGFVLVVALAACAAGPGAPTAPVGEPALLGDAEIDRAALVLPGARAAVVGEERPELGTLPTAADTLDTEARVPARTLTALPDATGLIAFVRHDPNHVATPWMLFVMDQASGEITYVYGGRREIDSVAVSADGDTLVASLRLQPDTSSNFQVFRATRSTGSVERITDTSFDERNVSLSADGTVVVWEGQVNDGRRAVFVREANTVLLLAAPHAQQQPSVSGNGRFIGLVRVLPSGNQRLLRYDRNDNTYLDLSQSGSRRVTLAHPSVSDDGERVAFLEVETRAGPPSRRTSQWQRVRYVDMLTKTVTNVAVAQITEVPVIAHPHLARDGDHLTYTWREQNASSLITHRISTATTQRIVSSALPISNLASYWQLPDADAPAVLSVTIDQGDQTLVIGDTLHLTATVDAVADANAEVDWLSGDPGLATITPDGHLTALAAGTTTITATSTVDPTISATITVTIVDDDGSAMILTVDTTLSSGTTVTLPLFGTVDVTVDWGDGTSSTANTPGLLDHDYALDGEYTIRIRGTLTQFGPGDVPYANVDRLISVRTWGDLGLQSLGSAFRNASNLTGVPDWLPATVTTLNDTFSRANAFNGQIGDWDTSNVTDMSSLFYDALAFDRDIGTWDTSNVTTMQSMFDGATAFNQDIGGWDVSNVTDMRDLFNSATSFNQDLALWCVPRIPTQPDGFDTNATSWTAPRPIWGTCGGVTVPRVLSVTIDQGNQALLVGDALQLTTTVEAIGGASDAVAWISDNPNVAQVGPDGSLIAVAAGTTTIIATAAFDPSVSDSITVTVTIDDGSAMILTVDTTLSSGTTVTLPLFGTVDVTVDWGDGTSSTADAPGLLSYAYALDGEYTIRIRGTLTQYGAGNAPVPRVEAFVSVVSWGDLGLQSLAGAFRNASNLTGVPDWLPATVTSLNSTFDRATAFNGDIGGWDTSNVTDLTWTFLSAIAFDRDIGAWDTSSVTAMRRTFEGAIAFDRDIGNWNTSAVTDMSGMFLDAAAFDHDIGRWDVTNVTDMRDMFGGAIAFNQDLSPWCVPLIPTQPEGFDAFATSWTAPRPIWGTCAGVPSAQVLSVTIDQGDQVLRVGYELQLTATVDTTGGASDEVEWFSGDSVITTITPDGYLTALAAGTTTITATSTVDPTISATIAVAVEDHRAMVLTIDTVPVFGRSFTLPLWGTVDVTVDWGDGQTRVVTAPGNLTHTYAEDGAYTLTITGSLTHFGNGIVNYPNAQALTGVTAWGELGLERLAGAFHGASRLKSLPATFPAGVWDASHMFALASSFNGDITGWDVSSVTDMRFMFSGASAFDRDIGVWDVSNVTTMVGMFQQATSFDRELASWDVSRVTDMTRMFSNATRFNRDLGKWDTGAVTSLARMFGGATAFNGDLDGWNTSNVTDMSYTFQAALAFNRDIGGWDTSNVTTMVGMFSVAQAFNQDIGRWNTGRVTTMNSMFANASRFNQNIADWDTSNVADFIAMFSRASDFNQDISRWDIRSAWTLEKMFSYATSFNQDIRAWDTSHVRIFADLFQAATSFDQDIGDWDTGNATSMRNMFDGATAFNQDIGRWDTSKVTWTYMMFQGATAFNQAIGGWDTGNVTNMLRMFGGATAFNQDIGSWDTSKVRDMEGMFERAWAFNQDIGGWDTSSVEKMPSMFDDAKAFDQDIGGWNTAKVWTMQTMFRDATSFNRDLSRWCVEKITSIPPLFAAGADAWVLPRPVWGTCPE